MERARAVVIGGGITGASVAYHLAKGGWTDVALVEKWQLTSGSTCHAARLVTQFNPSPTMMRFRRYSIELYEELGVFEPVGSLRLASSEAQLMELERGISRARGIGSTYRDPVYAAETARESYRYYYRLRYPFDTDESGRPRRTSPLHGRLQELGCVFGTKSGWERPDYLDPAKPWRRAGADQRAFGWSKPPWFERIRAEHEAFRERVGIIDMTSFGKIEVSGPGARPLLERVSDNLVDRPVGSVIYTQFLNDRGGIVADVTVTRLGPERFRVVTGAAFVAADLGWLRLNVRDEDGPVEVRDTTDELAATSTCSGSSSTTCAWPKIMASEFRTATTAA